MVEKAQVYQALEKVLDPALERSLVDLGMIEDVEIDGNRVTVYFAPDTLACPLLDGMVQQIEQKGQANFETLSDAGTNVFC
jgi:ATP-binding protein involved in chromosome partitioning